MAYRNLDEFVIRLEQQDEIITIDTPITHGTQITQAATTQAAALWFDAVSGSDFPVVANLFGTAQRMAWALGVDRLDDLSDNLARLVDFDFSGGFGSLINRAGMMMSALRSAGMTGNRNNSVAPAQAVKKPTLSGIPFLTFWSRESHSTLTKAQIIVGQHDNQHIQMATVALIDENTIAIEDHLVPPDAAIAIVLGGDPAAMWSAGVPLPHRITPYWLAGWLRRKPVPMVKAVTQPLTVPGDAEIIIEGQALPDTLPVTFGSDTGFLVENRRFRLIRITQMTHRDNALLPLSVSAPYAGENHWINKATERLLAPIFKTMVEEVRDINHPGFGGGTHLTLVQCHNTYPGAARKVLHSIWGIGKLAEAKTVIVVDESVDVQDPSAVLEAIINNVDWQNDVMYTHGTRHTHDPFITQPGYGSKIGIDATVKPSRTQCAHVDQNSIGIDWQVWHNILVIPITDATTDLNVLSDAIWRMNPTYHLIFVDDFINVSDLQQTIWYVLMVVDWQHNIRVNRHTCTHGRVAINAVRGEEARRLCLIAPQKQTLDSE